jgi:hypothetical protein
MLPQESPRLILVLLGNHFPALITEQYHKQPTWYQPHPLRGYSGSDDVALGRFATLQPATSDGVLVQGEQTGDITQVGERHVA